MFFKIAQPRSTWMTPSFYCFFTVNDSTRAIESVNSDLQRSRNCCFDNCLMLNSEKTKLMVFGSRRIYSK